MLNSVVLSHNRSNFWRTRLLGHDDRSIYRSRQSILPFHGHRACLGVVGQESDLLSGSAGGGSGQCARGLLYFLIVPRDLGGLHALLARCPCRLSSALIITSSFVIRETLDCDWLASWVVCIVLNATRGGRVVSLLASREHSSGFIILCTLLLLTIHPRLLLLQWLLKFALPCRHIIDDLTVTPNWLLGIIRCIQYCSVLRIIIILIVLIGARW